MVERNGQRSDFTHAFSLTGGGRGVVCVVVHLSVSRPTIQDPDCRGVGDVRFHPSRHPVFALVFSLTFPSRNHSLTPLPASEASVVRAPPVVWCQSREISSNRVGKPRRVGLLPTIRAGAGFIVVDIVPTTVRGISRKLCDLYISPRTAVQEESVLSGASLGAFGAKTG